MTGEEKWASLTRLAYIRATSAYTPLATSAGENYEAIYAGKSSVKEDPRFDCFTSSFADLTPDEDQTRLETMVCRSLEPVLGSGVDMSEAHLILCTTKGDIEDLQSNSALLPDLAGRIARHCGITTTPVVLSMACTSGTMGLITAQRMISSGKAKHVLVVGADQVTPFVIEGFRSFHALSQSRCSPYDRDRDGINLGEAAVACLLSSEQGDATLAVSGGGTSNDANHISGPSRTGDGLHIAVERALKNSGKTADQIDFISAHGTATSYNDEMESKAFGLSVLNEKPLHSLKGYFGHTLGAAGLLESIMCMESLDNQSLPASLGYQNAGTSVPLQVLATSQEAEVESCLKTSSGFGGCNAAVVIEKI